MLSTKDIIIEKHARIFISKPVNQQDEVWILFHGYAQNVKEFFNSFTKKEFENKSFIIPEGLSRFYQKGINGKVGASWMTKENKELEVIDQKRYLDQVLENFDLSKQEINIFAFSQGASAAARWISTTDLNIKKLIFWSGNIPQSILLNKSDNLWKHSPHFYIGKNDQFATLETWSKFTKNLSKNEFTIYKGDHFFTAGLIDQYVL
jgi:predicted esterase